MTPLRAVILTVVLVLQLAAVHGLKQRTKVVIAGASSSVGYIVFHKLMKRKSFFPVGIVKDKKAFKQLEKLGVPAEQLRICDITRKADLHGSLDGAEKVVICTSAVPKRGLRNRIGNFFRGLVGMATTPSTEAFYYEKGQRPYEVDYVGQKNIIDECRKAGVAHVVLLGNMGGTQLT
jgi:nucleoside-diphosphate-sugar epimerase